MSIKRMTEEELFAELDAYKAHADELAEPLPKELAPLESLKGSVKRYEGPLMGSETERAAQMTAPKTEIKQTQKRNQRSLRFTLTSKHSG